MKVVRSIFEIAHETIFLLRRGPIFFPAVLFILVFGVFAIIAGSWGVAEFRKVLFDMGGFGFHFIGSSVAIIWSIKLLAVSRLDGSLEVQLASPVSRSHWLLGRFLGIYISLLMMGFLMLTVWQSIMLFTDFGFFKKTEIISLTLQILGWGVIAAISLFFASFCGLITALFSSFALWISGLLTELVALTVKEEVGNTINTLFQGLSYIWNLQHFNRSTEYISQHGGYTLLGPSLYAFLLISFFLCFATLMFSRSFE